jgi:hypothetical protein
MRQSAVFSLGMKLGNGEGRDSLGRFYSYYNMFELLSILSESGFEEIARFFGEDQGLTGNVEPWVIFHLRKKKTE